MRILMAGLAMGLLSGFASQQLRAHPHSWIDLKTDVIFNEKGLIEGFEINWLFDEFYTAFILDEFTATEERGEDYLRAIAQTNLINLREYNYFTVIEQEGETKAIGDVERYQTGFRDDRLWLEFTIPLAEPLDPRASPVVFRNYDPTYYIEILHAEDGPVSLGADAPEDCATIMKKPDPTADIISLAFSLDFTQTETDGLGIHFAETVTISCA